MRVYEPSAFGQEDYNFCCNNLDRIMHLALDKFGKTEEEAQEWLKDFVSGHYFKVWRAISLKQKEEGPYELP